VRMVVVAGEGTAETLRNQRRVVEDEARDERLPVHAQGQEF
jgi:hypothetical protein